MGPRMSSIRYLDYHIPENSVSVDELLSINGENPFIQEMGLENYIQFFKEQSRLERITVYQDPLEMIKAIKILIQKLIDTEEIDPSHIKYLVCGNETLLDGDISIAHYIVENFKMKNAVIIPMTLTCASNLLAMGLSSKLLFDDGQKEYMLIISARKCSDFKGRYVGFTLMGDGLSVILVENTTGKLNIKNWYSSENGKISYGKINENEQSFDMSAIQKHIIPNGVDFIQSSLEKSRVHLEDLQVIIQPNTNYSVWQMIYPTMLGLEYSPFYLNNIAYGGHINDVDYARNLKDFINYNKDEKKGHIALYGANLTPSGDLSYHLCMLEIGEGSELP